ncbi:MAG: DUF2283 domain-containing protein [Elusimicrobia bacterium]|nr:DUF2283 domain-containing protein [Elusimicrobiota bacterium]
MKITYDPKVDAAYIRFKEGKFEVTTHQLTEDITINYAPDGRIVGIEILDAGKYLFKHKKPQIEIENLQPVLKSNFKNRRNQWRISQNH